MQAVIYYFTGTHNTLMVCEKYQEEFAKKGVQCILHPVNQLANIPDPTKSDLSGLPIPYTVSTLPTLCIALCAGCQRLRTRTTSL